jgi:hypothetical protein
MYEYQLIPKWCGWSILIIIHALNSQFGGLLQCPPLFCCCLFLFDPEAIIYHWWGIESKWVKKHMDEYQITFKWCNWSVLIIIHVLNSQFGGCCNAHHCVAALCSYLIQRPLFATPGDECSQCDWQRTGMGTTSSAAAATWLERSPLIFQSLKSWLESLSAKELESSVEVRVALRVAGPKNFWPYYQAGWMGEAFSHGLKCKHIL